MGNSYYTCCVVGFSEAGIRVCSKQDEAGEGESEKGEVGERGKSLKYSRLNPSLKSTVPAALV